MYKQFCKNFENYLSINQKGIKENEYRLKIVEPLMGLTNSKLYHEWKENHDIRYGKASNLFYEIKKCKEDYHSFYSFSWELWAYGFDCLKSGHVQKEILNEQIKLVDLLLGTHYWIDNSVSF